MIYVLYGEDDFTVKETLDRIREESGGAELAGGNVVRFDAARVSAAEVVAACNTISFLSPKRLVVVEGLLGIVEGSGKGGRGRKRAKAPDGWESFANDVSAMPESTVLVLVDGNVSKTNHLVKQLMPIAEVKECRPPVVRSRELEDWVRSRAKSGGCDISPKAVRLLIDLIGNNLWVLSSEIEKLSVHANGGRIEEAHVRDLVSLAREANVFHMVDAIVEGRHRVASSLAHQLMVDGAAPPYLLFMITRQFRLLVEARDMMSRGEPAGAVGKRLGLASGFVLDKTLEQARQYSMARLENTYRRLLDADLSIKRGTMDGELALDVLITDLCGQ